MGLTPKQTERKGSSILYFKQSETIEELLALMGAPVSAMTVMQAKIEKDWRNDANRKTNCDTANVSKAVDAAQEQLAALRTLEAQGRLDTLPEKLLQTALLRREHGSTAACQPALFALRLNVRHISDAPGHQSGQ